MRRLYSLVLSILAPLVLLRLWLRGRRAPAYRRRWAERFGYVDKVAGHPVWIHAVSVGEAQAAAPMIKTLLERYPDIPLLVTTTTPTGSARVKALFGEQVHHVYMPYDLPGAVKRFLLRVQPRLVLIMETEIWPNLFHFCHRDGVPVVIANARMSERSAKGYGRFPGLTTRTLANVTVIAAQDQRDAARFAEIGAVAERIVVTGSIKFDITLPASLREQGEVLRRETLGQNRPVWIAASTHAGEDELILDAFALVREREPSALLVLVPRHPERFEQVVALSREHGYRVVQRSEGVACRPETEVFVGDTMGEMMLFYAASDVAFIGGSLVPVGGHNVLEAAALALPIVYGPHMFNFEAIHKLFIEVGAARQIRNVDDLADVVATWLGDADQRCRVGQQGLRLVQGNRGALARLLAIIEQQLATLPARR